MELNSLGNPAPYFEDLTDNQLMELQELTKVPSMSEMMINMGQEMSDGYGYWGAGIGLGTAAAGAFILKNPEVTAGGLYIAGVCSNISTLTDFGVTVLMAFDDNYSKADVEMQALKSMSGAVGINVIKWRLGEATTNYFFRRGIPGAKKLIWRVY